MVEAKVNAMVYQVYFSVSVSATLFLIWLVAASSEPMTFTGSSFSMGILFAVLWISSQISAYEAISRLGYAVGPAVWIGVTICSSFAWGCAAFGNPVKSGPGSALAIFALLSGVCCAAGSSMWSDVLKKQARQRLVAAQALNREAEEPKEDEDVSDGDSSRRLTLGFTACVFTGLCNGSLMVPMTCFENGCASVGVDAYGGMELAPLAFLPSQSAGVLLVQPIMFVLYFSRQLLAGSSPDFHFKIVALPGLLTGAFWAMGFFNAMWATLYLGQTIGFPLTQLCIVLNGLWGILYYREISGLLPIGLFALGSAVLIVGAVLDGKYG